MHDPQRAAPFSRKAFAPLFFIVFCFAAHPALSEEDALSPPPPETGLHLARPAAPPDSSREKFEVVQPTAGADAVENTASADASVDEATPSATATEMDPLPAPTSTPPPDKHSPKAKGKPSETPTPRAKPTLPWVTTIPNPARGTKVDFRIMTQGPATAHIVIYNRFLDRIDKLEAKGDHLFDALWSLKHIPEGLYYYQVQIDDGTSGQSQVLPIQKFAVLKN